MTAELPRIGFGLPIAGPWAAPDVVADTARLAETLGYSSLWTFQRVLCPAGRDLQPPHRAVHDSIVMLSYVAGLTSSIGLGTATLCAPFVAPVLLAKAVTTLDVMSGGRLTVGLGSGWLTEEFAAVGVPFERRGARLDEYLRCLDVIWAADPVSFEGDFYTLPVSDFGLRPVQRPHPPILLGGTAPAALQRAGGVAQGWIGSSDLDLDRIGPIVETVRSGALLAGRDPESLRIVVRCVPELVDANPGRRRRPMQGTRSQILDDLVSLRTLGVTEVFFDLNLSRRVGFPDVDVGEAVDYSQRVLHAFACERRN